MVHNFVRHLYPTRVRVFIERTQKGSETDIQTQKASEIGIQAQKGSGTDIQTQKGSETAIQIKTVYEVDIQTQTGSEAPKD